MLRLSLKLLMSLLITALFFGAGAAGFAFGVSTWDTSDSRGWMG